MVHSKTAYVGGAQSKASNAVRRILDVERVLGVANGTDALRIALWRWISVPATK